MISKLCQFRKDHVIPGLLRSHGPGMHSTRETVDLSCAENWFMKNNILEHISNNASASECLSEEALSYSQDIGGCVALRESVAKLFNEHLLPNRMLDSRDVVLGAGASYVLDALVESICDPGDMVLIATPYWNGLDMCISIHNEARVLPVSIPLAHFFTIHCLNYYEAALATAEHTVKALIICNPHNPLGRPYPRDVLEKIISFANQHGIHLISDEVYALSTYKSNDSEPTQFWSTLSTKQDSKLLHVVYSLSKDFGCNGARLGVLISENEDVRLSVALSTHEQASKLTASLTAKHVLTEEIIKFAKTKNRASLQLAYDRVAGFCRKFRIPYVPACAGMFLFAKLCGSSDEEAFQERLKVVGVLLSAGLSYHFSEPGWFRICFGVKPCLLETGLERLASVLRETEQTSKIGTVRNRPSFSRKRKAKSQWSHTTQKRKKAS